MWPYPNSIVWEIQTKCSSVELSYAEAQGIIEFVRHRARFADRPEHYRSFRARLGRLLVRWGYRLVNQQSQLLGR